MTNMDNKYGKSPFNPIQMIGVKESLLFLNSLITVDNKPIFYHRIHTTSIGNSMPIDCYEIFKEGGFKEFLFIDVYASKNSEELPEGYAKAKERIEPLLYNGSKILTTIGVNFKLSDFPDELI
jgi:hypothetical protein